MMIEEKMNRHRWDEMKQYWTWRGKYIGVRQGDYLVTYGGNVLGKFYGQELYNQEGHYIGEIGRNERMFRDVTKNGFRRPIFSYGVKGSISPCYRDCSAYPLLAGQEDFVFTEDK